MRTEVSLEVLGLCIVLQPEDGDANHSVVAVDTSAFPGIPPHHPYLTFSRKSLFRTEGSVPPFEVASKSYSSINRSMFSMRIPAQTTVVLAAPDTPLYAGWEEFPAARISDLGLGRVKAGVGGGTWQLGEAARFRLPKGNAKAGWGKRLGEYTFPANQETRVVAELFFWNASYDGLCRFSFQSPEGTELGAICLDGEAEVRIACYAAPEPVARKPFDYCSALTQLSTGGTPQIPQRKDSLLYQPIMFHPGSGSCPPSGGP